MGLLVRNLFVQSIGLRGIGGSSPVDWNNLSETKLLASDGAANDHFAHSVAISDDGNTAVIGAYLDDDTGDSSGSAYIFSRSDSVWTPEAKLTASDGQASAVFGYSVSISGDGNTVLIGARGDNGKGAAYVFSRSGPGWDQEAKLIAADGASGDLFGASVSISGDSNTAVVGAYSDDNERGTDAGAVFVFVRSDTTWTQQAKLVAADGAAGDVFGYSVSVSDDGNTALIGAYADDSSRGSAYVYVRSGTSWTQQVKLLGSDGVNVDRFGYSVSISGDGDTALIGAYLTDEQAGNSGSAYVFIRSDSAWSQEAKLLAQDGAAGDQLGMSVSVSGDGNIALVGAPYDDNDSVNNSGSAYVFGRSDGSWSQTVKLLASDGAVDDLFGNSVSLAGNGNTVLIGAIYEDDNGTNAGAAYVYS